MLPEINLNVSSSIVTFYATTKRNVRCHSLIIVTVEIQCKCNCKAQVEVGSRRSKDNGQRPGPGLYIQFGLSPTPHHHHHQTFLGQKFSPNHYCMTSNHVPLISAFKMIFNMTFRMILRITFKTLDFPGVF